MRALVITASDRAAAGRYADTAGPVVVQRLREWGFSVPDATVVADGEPVRQSLRQAIHDDVAAVITTGGTGIGPRDHTPEVTTSLMDYLIPGIAEAIRAYGVAQGVPTAMMSRGVAGVAGRTVVVNLPGSVGGCRDGLAVLADVLPHAIDQVRGEDHPPPATSTSEKS
ncbi:MAG: MogA/MoaB family molybdenum cofactor biosynthesis protein [Actinomycetota bacterium]